VANPTTAAAPAGSLNAASPESQIVKVGTISIQVTGLDDSVTRATDQIHVLGGWLAGSDRTSTLAQDTASVTYRIPADKFEDALAVMRKLGARILGEHTESTPVGGQIVDLQARIANLRASEKALQAIMDKATTIEDILAVQQRLTDVQGRSRNCRASWWV
jgi:CRP-like cAMP-binding protein